MEKLKYRTLLFLLAFMTAALAVSAWGVHLPVSRSIPAVTDEFMWYYLPHAIERQPEPMEKASYIKDYSVLYVGPGDKKVIYLTFDDCPENGNIPAILDVLEKHSAPAAFL